MSSPGSTPPPGWSSPGPPESRAATALVWVLSIGAIVFGSVVGYQRFERAQDPTYYAVGYGLGTILTVAVLATLVNLLVRRARRIVSGPSPLALIAVSVLAVAIQHAYRGQQADRVEALVERCVTTDPDPFGPTPTGTTLEPAPAPATLARTPLPVGLSPDRFVLRRIVSVNGGTGTAAAYPGLGDMPDALHRYEATLGEVVVRSGGRSTWTTAPTGTVNVAEMNGLAMVTGRNGCWAIVVRA